MVPFFFAVVGFAIALRGWEGRLAERVLPFYVRTGWFAPPEVAALGSLGRRHSARQWARRVAGPAGQQAMKSFQFAATQLALLRDGHAARPATARPRRCAKPSVEEQRLLAEIVDLPGRLRRPGPADPAGVLGRRDLPDRLPRRRHRGRSPRPTNPVVPVPIRYVPAYPAYGYSAPMSAYGASAHPQASLAPPYSGPGYPAPPYTTARYGGSPYSPPPTHPGQPYPGQPYPGQPHAGQPYPGQPYAGQPYAGQPYPGRSYAGQRYPGEPYAGQSICGAARLPARGQPGDTRLPRSGHTATPRRDPQRHRRARTPKPPASPPHQSRRLHRPRAPQPPGPATSPHPPWTDGSNQPSRALNSATATTVSGFRDRGRCRRARPGGRRPRARPAPGAARIRARAARPRTDRRGRTAPGPRRRSTVRWDPTPTAVAHDNRRPIDAVAGITMPARGPALALAAVLANEYAVVQHPDRQSGLGSGVGAHGCRRYAGDPRPPRPGPPGFASVATGAERVGLLR